MNYFRILKGKFRDKPGEKITEDTVKDALLILLQVQNIRSHHYNEILRLLLIQSS